MKIMQGPTNSYYRNIESLKGRKDPEAIKAVAKEMEALFVYQMLKAMREATTISSKKSFGQDTYMSMFDMQISRLFAERGLGLQDTLIKGLNREIQKTESSEASSQPMVDLNTEDKKLKNLEGKKNQENENILNSQPLNSSSSQFEHTELNSDSRLSSLPIDGVISSHFGIRKDPIYGNKRFHHGVDIAAPAGTDVYPIQSGKVLYSGQQSGYGNIVIVDHGNGLISKYAHNEVNMVKEGDSVDTHTIIAKVGSTGRSTGSHLHLEVRDNGKSINPVALVQNV